MPWRRKWQPTPVFVPGEPHGQRSLAGCSPRGGQESDVTKHALHRAEVSLEMIRSHGRRPALPHGTHCPAPPARPHRRPRSLSTARSSHPRAFALKVPFRPMTSPRRPHGAPSLPSGLCSKAPPRSHVPSPHRPTPFPESTSPSSALVTRLTAVQHSMRFYLFSLVFPSPLL